MAPFGSIMSLYVSTCLHILLLFKKIIFPHFGTRKVLVWFENNFAGTYVSIPSNEHFVNYLSKMLELERNFTVRVEKNILQRPSPPFLYCLRLKSSAFRYWPQIWNPFYKAFLAMLPARVRKSSDHEMMSFLSISPHCISAFTNIISFSNEFICVCANRQLIFDSPNMFVLN